MSDKAFSEYDLREYKRRDNEDKDGKKNLVKGYLLFAWQSSNSDLDFVVWSDNFCREARRLKALGR